ncbi:NAD(P)/FAD-dependent oxidoreductase [Winogradskya humida]|uniref:FAD-dependent oxidoreductase n=1 Tax=Winogradskya humida TaxID=113566 RepID=A0ABQ4A1P4_9ACTN|nr:NAD(P)/FAD-dependent oxidoreductase [Actinoplanes humidus]GIE24277.1 FAD-dependent oxidoreductase [Actinoplanes humidus]
MYDAIVVGARCAGAPTAMLLARQGYRVLLLERAAVATDTVSTHYLHQPGVQRLREWGVLDAVVASGAPAMRRTVYEVAGIRLTGQAAVPSGDNAAYGPRRQVLDGILTEAAAQAGVTVRMGATVTGLLDDDGWVSGVRYTAGGREHVERCALVIGADGMRSTVARLAGARSYAERPSLTCIYYTYWQDLPADFELYEAPNRWVGTVRTNDDLTLVAAYFPHHEFDAVRKDAQRSYLKNIAGTAPDLAGRLAGATQVERLRAKGDQLNFLRQAGGPGWALVGDAGHHKDSITARGITDAFAQAALLAEHLRGVLPDRSRTAAALRAYGEERDVLLDPGYQATLLTAKLTVQNDRLALLRAIEGDQDLTDRYFAVVAGALPAEDLIGPELLARL